jgi:hypothetical protein
MTLIWTLIKLVTLSVTAPLRELRERFGATLALMKEILGT